jgi:hypothetical protein
VSWAVKLAEPRHHAWLAPEAGRIAEAVATMRSRLGDERFETLRVKGAALCDSEAVVFALECVGGPAGRLPARRPDRGLTAD